MWPTLSDNDSKRSSTSVSFFVCGFVFLTLEVRSFTVKPSSAIFFAAFKASFSGREMRIFAWPLSIFPDSSKLKTSGLRDRSLTAFAIVLLAFPVTPDISSCVKLNSLLSLSYPLASSTGFKFSR